MIRDIYFALVNSQLIYGISIWGSGGTVSNLSSLFVAQKSPSEFYFASRKLIDTALVIQKMF